MNEALYGDRRGTTQAGPRRSRFCANAQQPTNWLVSNKTGGTPLHVGLPADSRVGDKTSQSERPTTSACFGIRPDDQHLVLLMAFDWYKSQSF